MSVSITPVGMQSRETFEQSIEDSSGLITGLVVAIGIDDYEPAAHEHLMPPVTDLLESMLGGKGCGARMKPDEFILVFAGQGGSAGQWLLSQISERLWDFQLRSLAAKPILLSCGAVEAVSAPLSEAMAAANERRLQTERGIRLPAMAM